MPCLEAKGRATVLGYAVFGEVPNLLTLAGAANIIAAGLYIFWREQMQAGRDQHRPCTLETNDDPAMRPIRGWRRVT